jgi:hypothetical protein
MSSAYELVFYACQWTCAFDRLKQHYKRGQLVSRCQSVLERKPRSCVRMKKYFCIFARVRVWVMRMSSVKRYLTSTRLKWESEQASGSTTTWMTFCDKPPPVTFNPALIPNGAVERFILHHLLPPPVQFETRARFPAEDPRGFVPEILKFLRVRKRPFK